VYFAVHAVERGIKGETLLTTLKADERPLLANNILCDFHLLYSVQFHEGNKLYLQYRIVIRMSYKQEYN